MKLVNQATVRRIKQLVVRKAYSYSHIKLLVALEGLGDPSVSFISKIAREVKRKK